MKVSVSGVLEQDLNKSKKKQAPERGPSGIFGEAPFIARSSLYIEEKGLVVLLLTERLVTPFLSIWGSASEGEPWGASIQDGYLARNLNRRNGVAVVSAHACCRKPSVCFLVPIKLYFIIEEGQGWQDRFSP